MIPLFIYFQLSNLLLFVGQIFTDFDPTITNPLITTAMMTVILNHLIRDKPRNIK